MKAGRYEYRGSAEGELLTRIIWECSVTAAIYGVRQADFDDVVHDALIACQKKQKFDAGRGVMLWTYMRKIVRSAAQHTCIRLVRTAWREADLSQTRELEQPATDPQPCPTVAHRLAALRMALTKLPRMQRRVIVLRYGLTGKRPLTIKETAAKLGISIATVKRHAAAAKRAMRISIGDQGADHG